MPPALHELGVWLKAVGWTQQRKWGEFFEVFKKPASWSDFEERLFTNGLYYRTNYLLLAAGISTWWFLSDLLLLVATLLVIAAWVYVYGVVTVPFVVSSHVVTPPQAFLGLCVTSTLLLSLFSRLYSMLTLVAVVAIVVIAHASLRPRNTKSRVVRSFMGMKVWFMSNGDDDDAALDGDTESGVGVGGAEGGGGDDDGLRRRDRSGTPGRGESYAASRAKLLKATAGARRDD